MLKKITFIFFCTILLCNCSKKELTEIPVEVIPTFYKFKIAAINGVDSINFIKYIGKKVVVLNVASKCGFTPQYADWQAFYEKNKEKVEVLGFPSNDFANQEPGSDEDISQFCQDNFGITFQLFEKVKVTGADKSPLYRWLTDKTQNGWNEQEPTWNFCKYIINEKGELTHFFPIETLPTNAAFLEAMK